jgi:alkylhydroperoxidase family enzyme
VTEQEVAMIAEGPSAKEWDPFDAALLAAADQLHHDGRIDDETWATLAGRYDERQLIELNMLVGEYHLMAFTVNSLGVKDEDGAPGLPEEWSREKGRERDSR